MNSTRTIKGWVDGILTTRKPEEIASATLFTQDLYDGSVPATLIIGEEIPPKEGERALTVEQIMEVWDWCNGCDVPHHQRREYFRINLIDKLGDGK